MATTEPGAFFSFCLSETRDPYPFRSSGGGCLNHQKILTSPLESRKLLTCALQRVLLFPESRQDAPLNAGLQGSGLERVFFQSIFYWTSSPLSYQQHCHRHMAHGALFLKTVLESLRLGVIQTVPIVVHCLAGEWGAQGVGSALWVVSVSFCGWRRFSAVSAGTAVSERGFVVISTWERETP